MLAQNLAASDSGGPAGRAPLAPTDDVAAALAIVAGRQRRRWLRIAGRLGLARDGEAARPRQDLANSLRLSGFAGVCSDCAAPGT